MGNFFSLLSLRKDFFSALGYFISSICLLHSKLLFHPEWLPFPIVLKRNEATHLFFLARLSVTATDMSLHTVFGVSDEQLVASATEKKRQPS